jgi:hypothetical protein
MAYATLNGKDAISATLSVPRVGAWRADLMVDAEATTGLTGAVTLAIDEGKSRWVGRVFRGGENFGRVELRVVGGAGGLAKQLPGKSYRNTNARVLLTDILGAAGERLSPSVAPALLAVQLAAWSRAAGTASSQLTAALDTIAPGAVWRVLPDGTVWLGAETWPTTPAFESSLLERDPREGRLVLAGVESYRLLPGQTLDGQRVAYVEHHVSAEALRTLVFFEAP